MNYSESKLWYPFEEVFKFAFIKTSFARSTILTLDVFIIVILKHVKYFLKLIIVPGICFTWLYHHLLKFPFGLSNTYICLFFCAIDFLQKLI